MVVIWKNLSGGLFDLYEIVPAFIVSCILIVAGTYLFPGPRELPVPETGGGGAGSGV
jgi:hypothetical protein